MNKLGNELIIIIQNSLLSWYTEFGRKYPWRETKNPYFVLVIEKLLQQTSIRDSIVEIYNYLIRKYPEPSALAKADPEELSDLIQPLGLHYRVRDFILMAKDINEKYGNVVPSDLKSLLSIYGIGDYSARAVLSFAFEQDIPVVDTNIARILFRVFELPGNMPANPARNRLLIELMGGLIPEGNSRNFNWGMIDLGSLVCKSSNPNCDKCPLQDLCAYYQANRQYK